ncbi:dTTP/UTP pyrophosphatase-like isoform X2 [Convolutriloba macropyga]|uniref:dTTP/UTP pyrophosphatase-like isoform X2 n=1 Tax=Convolutriloba macropyga TaxID=536237 RepID=UPI003F523353
MISDVLSRLNALCIVLGSSSPRRQQLLAQIGLKYTVVKSNFPEDLAKNQFEKPVELIIGADTVVVLDGRIMEKPASADEAKRMLKSFSGRAHQVISSCVLLYKTKANVQWNCEQFETVTDVNFATLSDSIIEAYVATGDSFDKAGGYGAQGIAGSFIEAIHGDFYNVVGLPLQPLSARLRDIVITHF